MWRYAVGFALCAVLGYFAFVRGQPVPLLSYADLGFHELGHFIMYPLPVGDLATAIMGSVLQVVVPMGLAIYFFTRRKDLMAAGLCSAWTATSLQNVSVYIADAPYERLELIGGDHDWAYLLSPEQFDAISAAGTVASAVKAVGVVFLLVGLGLCLAGPFVTWRPEPKTRPYGPAKPVTGRSVPGQAARQPAQSWQPGDILPRP